MTLVRSPAPFSTSSLVLSSSFTPATSAPKAGKATHKENIKTALVSIFDTRSPKGSARAARRVALHVHRLAELFFQPGSFGVVAARAKRSGGRHLRKMHAQVRRAADADADDGRRAGLAAGLQHAIDHERLDGVHALGGDCHPEP